MICPHCGNRLKLAHSSCRYCRLGLAPMRWYNFLICFMMPVDLFFTGLWSYQLFSGEYYGENDTFLFKHKYGFGYYHDDFRIYEYIAAICLVISAILLISAWFQMRSGLKSGLSNLRLAYGLESIAYLLYILVFLVFGSEDAPAAAKELGRRFLLEITESFFLFSFNTIYFKGRADYFV